MISSRSRGKINYIWLYILYAPPWGLLDFSLALCCLIWPSSNYSSRIILYCYEGIDKYFTIMIICASSVIILSLELSKSGKNSLKSVQILYILWLIHLNQIKPKPQVLVHVIIAYHWDMCGMIRSTLCAAQRMMHFLITPFNIFDGLWIWEGRSWSWYSC